MIGGALLFEFCLFMISISQAEHFYQVRTDHSLKYATVNEATFIQLFLAQGVGLGIAVGVMYIPAIGVISHYFHRKRALAIGLGTSVCLHTP